MSEIEPLAPCPFCGCSDIEFGIDVGACHPLSLPENEEQKYYYCQCKKCRCHYGYGTKEKCIKSWNTRPTPLAVVNGKDVEELASILENNPYDAIGLDSKQWAKIIIDAGYSKCQERSGLDSRVTTVSMSEKDFQEFVYGVDEEAVKKTRELFERSNTPQGLKPLSSKEVLEFESKVYEEWITDDELQKMPYPDYLIKEICAKFAVPNEGLSKEEIRKILGNYICNCTEQDLLEGRHECTKEIEACAKAILTALENKR